MARWYTADWHLGHRNIITHCDRPFDDVEEMNWAIITNMAEAVEPGDSLWVLGDVAFRAIHHFADLLTKISRYTDVDLHLVSGNHDGCWGGHRRPGRIRNQVVRHQNSGFSTVQDTTWHRIGPQQVQLHHFPFSGDHSADDRYQSMRPVDYGQWLLCGHVHEEWAQSGRCINVGVDVRNFQPVHEDDIAEMIQ